MKNKLLFFIFICILIILLKYRFSNYEITYKVNNYNINEVYKNKRFYFEIYNEEHSYNFDVYSKRVFSKTLIKKITRIDDDNFSCIVPNIKNIDTYPLCYADNQFTDFNLINSDKLDKYKSNNNIDKETGKDFVYYNGLNKNEYIALWNYKGYTIMHKDYKNINLFKKDRYDNSLAYMLDDTIYMANYDQEYEYSSLITLNIVSQSVGKIELGYNLDYDSYIVGSVKNKIYIFDNKHSLLYEINTRNNKVNIIGNSEKGFVKYEKGEFVSCSKSEYKVNKIKYNEPKSIYNYQINNGVSKTIKDNNKIIQKISLDNINIISENNNEIYYIYEDNFYKYTPSTGNKKIFYNYELNFNSNNTVFTYIK